MKSQFTMQTLFRNKTPRSKFEKIVDQARRCKVNLVDELRALENWLKEAEKYFVLFDE
jgi:uncharacterized protein YbgA (DUF1722 family)